MPAAQRLSWLMLATLFVGSGCAPSRAVEGVWRPGPGDDPNFIPGPMSNFGPFESYSDALKAACPFILSRPNATVGHLKDSNPGLAVRTATEYCAWLYYTPDHTYEMSLLTDASSADDLVSGRKSCVLPTFVSDSRYVRDELQYVFALHNHPFGSELSPQDLRFIEDAASVHAWEIQTKRTKVRLATIAFFSRSKDSQAPTCDGFHQYIPATRELMTWTQTRGQWDKTSHGIVRWLDDKRYRIDAR